MTTRYEQSYNVSYNELYAMIKAYEEVRKNALPILDIELEFSEIKFPDATVKYEEIPDELLVPIVVELADELIKLCEKIKKFC